MKLPLEQKELQQRVEDLSTASSRAIWDTLLALSSKDQATVREMLDYAKSDSVNRLLIAIEIGGKTRTWNLSGSKKRKGKYVMIFVNKEHEFNDVKLRKSGSSLGVLFGISRKEAETEERALIPDEKDVDDLLAKWTTFRMEDEQENDLELVENEE